MEHTFGSRGKDSNSWINAKPESSRSVHTKTGNRRSYPRASENPTGHLLLPESLDRRIRISKRVTPLSERGEEFHRVRRSWDEFLFGELVHSMSSSGIRSRIRKSYVSHYRLNIVYIF